MKVLHLPTDTGGNAWGLSRGERILGLSSDVLAITQSSIGYEADIQLNLDKMPPYKGLKYFKLVKTFLNVRSKYDIYHFNYGSSLLHRKEHPWLYQIDLPFYHKKAKLFATYNGCDARQKFPTMQRTSIAACHNDACYGGMCNSGEKDKERRLSIQKMSRYVDHIWALNPDLLYFLPLEKASFLPYTVAATNTGLHVPKLDKKLKVVHAPTNQVAKGSGYILSALDCLQKKYPGLIDVCLVQNMAHADALEVYKQADLVIDQVLIGWYGAFAVETMMMGKPVIARIAIDDMKFIPPKMADELLQTVIQADPETVEGVIEKCLHDRSFLKQRSEASVAYATKWHDPLYVASLTKEKYES
jgi:hypothetical protein